MCKKILIVVEDSKASHTAIQIGLETAQAHGANVLFYSVLPRPEALLPSLDMVGVGLSEEFHIHAREQLRRVMKTASEKAESLGVHSFRAMGTDTNRAECISNAANHHHCDMIVVGTEESNAVMRLLTGSVVPGLITSASVPVLVCKEPAHIHRPTRTSTARI